MKKCWIWISGIALLTGPGLFGQADQYTKTGFSTEQAYHMADVDAVNIFNGKLTVSIPLGQRYKVNGALEYGLNLTYTGPDYWIGERDNCVFSGSCLDPLDYIGDPAPYFNAGFGWVINPGLIMEVPEGRYLTSVWRAHQNHKRYLAPDGSQRLFYNGLYHGESPASGTYTRDNTYLRLRGRSGGGYFIDFPNGETHEFGNKVTLKTVDNDPVYDKDGGGVGCCTTVAEAWRVTKITDKFGNWVNFSYSNTVWTISDSTGRSHTVKMRYVEKLKPYTYTQGHIVDYVDMASANGTTRYDITHKTTEIVEGCTGSDHNDPDNNRARERFFVQEVTGLTRPAGGNYTMTTSLGLACDPVGLTSLQLPTLGKIQWSYAWHEMPVNNEESLAREQYPDYPSVAVKGVSERVLFNPNGTEHGRWKYVRELSPAPTGNSSKPKEVRVHVRHPTGHCSKHFYDADPGWASSGSDAGWAYGLPFSQSKAKSNNRFLSVVEWSSATSSGLCSGTKLREKYVRYEHDPLPSWAYPTGQDRWGYTDPWMQTDLHNTNRRLQSSHTVYLDDDDKIKETIHSNFDGYGNYKQTVTRSTFKGSSTSSDQRTVFTDYDANRSPWLLGLFKSVTVTDANAYGTNNHKTTFSFNRTNGFLKSRRTYYNGTATNSKDQIVTFTNDGKGNVSQEAWGCGGSCSQSYTINHEYSKGSLSRSLYSGTGFNTYRADINAATGLPTKTYDVSGLSTTYTYDALGRLTKAQEEQGARHTYKWTKASGNTPAKLLITHRSNGGSVDYYAEEYHYDGFGRLIKERREMPDGWEDRNTKYNARGRKTSVSEWGSTKKTVFQDFDAFGRPGEIVHPDGKKTILNYKGDSYVNRQYKIATSSNSEETLGVKEYYDHRGRLWKLGEKSKPGNEELETVYTYDIGGRLAKVSMGSQVREFDYDGRGFLEGEKHPEKKGNWVVYSEHDARGHAHRKQDGPHDLNFKYDAAERLTWVGDRSKGRPIKEFFYDQTTTYKAKGKLHKSIRHNYVTLPWNTTEQDISVTNYFTYDGTQGRVSKKKTDVARSGAGWVSTYTYDDLGLVKNLTYPFCANDGSNPCDGEEPSRYLNHNYQEGLLFEITGLIDSISYHPNGMWKEIRHTNGTVDTQTINNAMRRPSKIISKKGSTAFFDTGTYSYDGAGNISQIGSQQDFTYDAVSRLKMGQVVSGGQTYTETLKYDEYGNITEHKFSFPGGSSETLDINVNATNNRIIDIGGQGATYDGAGNLLAFSGNAYAYDPVNMPWQYNGGKEVYLYDADDERVGTIASDDGTATNRVETFSARGLDGKVLRQFVHQGPNPFVLSWKRDNFFRDGQPVATASLEWVDPLPVACITSPANGAALLVGDNVTFDASCSSDPDNDSLTYEWDFDDGATATGVTANHTFAAGSYTVVLTVSDATSSISTQISISIGHPPTLDQTLTTVSAVIGDTATFVCDVSGTGPFTYSWFKDGAALSDGGNISGAATNTLTITNVQETDIGEYSCQATSDFGQVQSAPARLWVSRLSLIKKAILILKTVD